jgi:hypothetical protein
MSSSPVDIEKDAARVGSAHDGAVPGETFEYGTSTYAKLQRLAGKLHVEQRGIERVPDDERDDHSLLNVGTMVISPLGRIFPPRTIDHAPFPDART